LEAGKKSKNHRDTRTETQTHGAKQGGKGKKGVSVVVGRREKGANVSYLAQQKKCRPTTPTRRQKEPNHRTGDTESEMLSPGGRGTRGPLCERGGGGGKKMNGFNTKNLGEPLITMTFLAWEGQVDSEAV